MLTELCQEIRNWFTDDRDKHFGTFTIQGGVLTPSDFLQAGQYYRIAGSVFNDGVHEFGDNSDLLIDETFSGAVWAMKVPKAVLDLAEEIAEWKEKNEAAEALSPYVSESFNGYSYTKGSAGGGTWETVFARRLNRWRKIL